MASRRVPSWFGSRGPVRTILRLLSPVVVLAKAYRAFFLRFEIGVNWLIWILYPWFMLGALVKMFFTFVLQVDQATYIVLLFFWWKFKVGFLPFFGLPLQAWLGFLTILVLGLLISYFSLPAKGLQTGKTSRLAFGVFWSFSIFFVLLSLLRVY